MPECLNWVSWPSRMRMSAPHLMSARGCVDRYFAVSVSSLCTFFTSVICVFSSVWVLLTMPFLEFEVADLSSGGQDVALVLGQVVLTRGLDVQVSVEALVGELSGRTVEPTVSKAV